MRKLSRNYKNIKSLLQENYVAKISCVYNRQKYVFMLITRNIYKYIMYLISNYCEINWNTYIRLIKLLWNSKNV